MSKVPCLTCAEDILPTTANKTGGYCMICVNHADTFNSIKRSLGISEQQPAKIDIMKSFPNLNLKGTKFGALSLNGGSFEGSDLTGARFQYTILTAASFRDCTLDGVAMSNAYCEGVDFSEASMHASRFENCRVSKAKFRNADLRNAKFEGADLFGSDFSDSDMTDVAFAKCKFNEKTIFPASLSNFSGLEWKGKGRNPLIDVQKLSALLTCESFDEFLADLKQYIDKTKIEKAIKMLRKESFQLFSEHSVDKLWGIVKSQTDPDLVYACSLDAAGNYSCCTQNLRPCGGLKGSLCKHLMVLLIGLSKTGSLDYKQCATWCIAGKALPPQMDSESAASIFLKYKGFETGEIDWRPTETIPEDYYV